MYFLALICFIHCTSHFYDFVYSPNPLSSYDFWFRLTTQTLHPSKPRPKTSSNLFQHAFLHFRRSRRCRCFFRPCLRRSSRVSILQLFSFYYLFLTLISSARAQQQARDLEARRVRHVGNKLEHANNIVGIADGLTGIATNIAG